MSDLRICGYQYSNWVYWTERSLEVLPRFIRRDLDSVRRDSFLVHTSWERSKYQRVTLYLYLRFSHHEIRVRSLPYQQERSQYRDVRSQHHRDQIWTREALISILIWEDAYDFYRNYRKKSYKHILASWYFSRHRPNSISCHGTEIYRRKYSIYSRWTQWIYY